MQFKKVSDSGPVVDYLSTTLKSKLQEGRKVLWLLSGGSAVEVEVMVASGLKDVDLTNLTVSLADERYGPVGHAESIWQQLTEAGFDLPAAKLLPVLDGSAFQDCASAWGSALQRAFDQADYKLALIGIGPDGHIAGLLPHSPAAEQETGLVFAYQSQAIPGVRPAFQRITLTKTAISWLDEAVVYATGQAKWPALEALERDMPVKEQPAQLLKKVNKLTIFNDAKGDAV